MDRPAPKPAPAWVGPLADYGPLVAFFVVYYRVGIKEAVLAIMLATPIALGLAYWQKKKIPIMPLVTAVVVGVFGGLTLAFDDERFFKMKPTIVQGLMSGVLLTGLALGKSWLRPVLGTAWAMDDVGWKKLTLRFALFFAVMAGVNEAVWRTQTTDFWVNFKVFGILGATFLFAMAQMPLLQRHGQPAETDNGPEGGQKSDPGQPPSGTKANAENGPSSGDPSPD